MREFDRLVKIMRRLRGPGGCPWDRRQSHASLIRYLHEEAREVERAIRRKNWRNLEEELGDLILQAVFHAQLASEKRRFDIRRVLNGISEKLIRRHPHVFGPRGRRMKFKNLPEFIRYWERSKESEKHAD